ncbi:MAG: bifunctional heptose 7-phosphate kinase/heptose 1-phosphate adenyltransferase [Candidatus Methylomirabilia bacterium]
MSSFRQLQGIVQHFPQKTVLVLGDLIADEYIYGKPDRVSREAPVLILRYQGREVRLGGAANASHNVHALGARVLPVGVVGSDPAGEEVLGLFQSLGMPTDAIVKTTERPTPVKTRVMAGASQSTRQQIVRVDREPRTPLDSATEAELGRRLMAWGPQADAILLSDYGYGTVTPGLLSQARVLGSRNGALLSADSRYDLLRFTGVTAATPNEPELEHLTEMDLDEEPSVEKAGRLLLERLDCRYLLITRGSKGMVLFEREGPITCLPIHGGDEIADVTGAGDTVISTFTVALASGGRPTEAAWLANVAGGVVVTKRGTAHVAQTELLSALAQDGIPGEP